MREQILELLTALGVTGADSDPLLDLVIQSVTDTIKNGTNQDVIPVGLESAAVYNAVGQYMKFKKNVGQLTGFDLEGAVKQIQEGDTNVVFAVGEGDMTPEGRLESLISWLTVYGKDQYYRYRRLLW